MVDNSREVEGVEDAFLDDGLEDGESDPRCRSIKLVSQPGNSFSENDVASLFVVIRVIDLFFG
jgi:hypothetical protein